MSSNTTSLRHLGSRAVKIMSVAALLAVVTIGITPRSASALPICVNGGTCIIRSVKSLKCLDVTGGPSATQNGARLQQYTCTVGQSNQFFKFHPVPYQPGYYLVSTFHTGHTKCLDVKDWSLVNGAPIQQNSCNYNAPNQWLKIVTSASGQYGYRLEAHSSSKCVDVNGASTANGAPVNQWTCYDDALHSNQRWTFETAT